MEYLPDHVLVSIFSKSQNILNLSEVCVRYHDLIASTTSLMKRVKINLTSPAKELLNKSTRKYQNVLIFPPINYHNDFFECLEPFSGSLQMLEIKFTVNTSFEGFREPLYSIYMERKSQQPPQVLQPLTTLQLPKLKKLVLAATDYKIFKYLKIQLNELVLEQCQTGSCEELKTFLKTQNQLKFLNLDRVSSRFLFIQVSNLMVFKRLFIFKLLC